MTASSEPQPGFFGSLRNRVLHTFFVLTRGLTLGVRAIVRSGDGKFLLVRHTYTPGWHFPGGGVELGETTVGALANELVQETGLRLDGQPVLHGVFYNKAVSRRDHVLAYVCKVNTDVMAKPNSPEIAEIGFFDLTDLPDGTDPGTIRRMREVVDGTPPNPEW